MTPSRPGWWQGSVAVALAACGSGSGPAQLKGSGLDFGATALGAVVRQPVTMTNAGATALTIASAALANDDAGASGFALGAGLVGSLAPGSSRSAEATFTPVQVGPAGAELIVTAENGSKSGYLLSGSGLSPLPTIGVSPASLQFMQVPIGVTAVKQVTLTNFGVDPVSVTTNGPVADGGYSLVVLPAMLPGFDTDQILVAFNPQEVGTYLDAIEVRGCANCAVQRINLAGEGVAALLSLTPSLLDFGAVPRGTSKILTLELQDLGRGDLQIDQVAILALDGGSPSPFSVASIPNGQPIPLPVDGGLELPVTFAPPSGVDPSPQTGTLIVTFEEIGLTLLFTQAVALIGSAELDCQLVALPTALDFGLVVPGVSPPARRALVLSDTGRDPCAVLDAGLTADSDSAFALSAAPAPEIDAGETVDTGALVFSPLSASAPWKRTGTLMLQTSGGPVAIALEGWAQPRPFAMDSPCPMYRCDPGHSGLNGANLANNLGSVQWTRSLGAASQPIVGGDGTVYIEAADGLHAIDGLRGRDLWVTPVDLPNLTTLGSGTPVLAWDGTLAVLGQGHTDAGEVTNPNAEPLGPDGGRLPVLPLQVGELENPSVSLALDPRGNLLAVGVATVQLTAWTGQDLWDASPSQGSPISDVVSSAGTLTYAAPGLLGAISEAGAVSTYRTSSGALNGATSVALASSGPQLLVSFSTGWDGGSSLASLDPLSGVANWVFDVPRSASPVSAAVRADGDLLFALGNAADGGELPVHLYRLSPNGQLVWQSDLPLGGSFRISPPVASADGYALVAGDQLGLVDSEGRLVWSLPTGPVAQGPVVGPDGAIYYLDSTQTLVCVR